MIVVIGEILIDRFPEYERIGGAPFNFAFHLKQMGWPVRFITRIGNDASGRRILQMLQDHGFRGEDIQKDDHHPTGRVDVSLDDQGVPRFDICSDAAYDHIDLAAIPESDLTGAQLIYFGSLIQRSAQGAHEVQHLLRRIAPATRVFCDINLRPPHINPQAIEDSLRHTDILKLNQDELVYISRLFSGPQNPWDRTAAWLMQTYHVALIALTLGAEGSRIITAGETFTSPSLQDTRILDTVGAGDAYAAVFAAGCLKHLPMQLIVESATEFAAFICGIPGAVPSDDSVYHALRRKFNG